MDCKVNYTTLVNILRVNHHRKDGNTFQRYAIISDTHSIFLDEKAFDIFLSIYKENDFTHLIINGDLLDFPTLSEHKQKIARLRPEVLDTYCLEDEIDYVKEVILDPLHRLKPSVKIMVRLGNHEERFINPTKDNARALSEILAVSRWSKSTQLEDILELKKFNAFLSYNGIDRIHNTFSLIHGVKTSEGTARANLKKYGCGTSGHSHRANSYLESHLEGVRGWWESGCLRTLRDIEYLPRGEIPNWQQAFLTLAIRPSGWFSCQTHLIVDHKCLFSGVLYD